MDFYVKCIVKTWIVLLTLIGSSSALFERGIITFTQCENDFATINTRIHSSAFNIAFNIPLEVCVQSCVGRPWCAAIIYDMRRRVCNVLFEDDLLFIESVETNEQRGLTCALLKKRDFPTDISEVNVVHLLTSLFCILNLYKGYLTSPI